jgi:hypothetical protein
VGMGMGGLTESKLRINGEASSNLDRSSLSHCQAELVKRCQIVFCWVLALLDLMWLVDWTGLDWAGQVTDQMLLLPWSRAVC